MQRKREMRGKIRNVKGKESGFDREWKENVE